jgi:hypothetical protein
MEEYPQFILKNHKILGIRIFFQSGIGLEFATCYTKNGNSKFQNLWFGLRF